MKQIVSLLPKFTVRACNLIKKDGKAQLSL